MSEKQLANLRPFQPGVSGNPSGRPKGIFKDELLRQILKNPKLLESAIRSLLNASRKEDSRALTILRDTLDGKPPQTISVDGDFSVSDKAERRTRIAELIEGMSGKSK